jgi:hypothetical protein
MAPGGGVKGTSSATTRVLPQLWDITTVAHTSRTRKIHLKRKPIGRS